MISLTSLRVMLLTLGSFSLGVGPLVALGDEKGLPLKTPYDLIVEHRVQGINEGGGRVTNNQLYRTETRHVAFMGNIIPLAELVNNGFRVKTKAIPTEVPLFTPSLMYVGVGHPAKVHVKFVDERGKTLWERDSESGLTLGGRLSFKALKNYQLRDSHDKERVAIKAEDNWEIKLKPIEAAVEVPTETPQPHPGPNLVGPSVPQPIPEPSSPQPPVISTESKVPTPSTSVPEERPVPVPGQPITHEVASTGKPDTTKKTHHSGLTLTMRPSTSTLPQLPVKQETATHQGAANWWQPVTSPEKPEATTQRHRTLNRQHQQTGPGHTPQSRSAQGRKRPEKRQLPQANEQTLPLAWLGGSLLLGLTSLMGYRRIYR